jgi:hypothetical protein
LRKGRLVLTHGEKRAQPRFRIGFFVADAGGRLEIFEAKWTELPDAGDTVNLEFVRHVIGKSRVAAGAGRLTRRYAL